MTMLAGHRTLLAEVLDTVVPPSGQFPGAAAVALDHVLTVAGGSAALDALLAGYAIPQDRVHLGEGDTREVLIASIEELHADIVVMGAVARGALQRMLLGSTAELILDHVPCDLLIVKPGTKKRRARGASKKKRKRSKR